MYSRHQKIVTRKSGSQVLSNYVKIGSTRARLHDNYLIRIFSYREQVLGANGLGPWRGQDQQLDPQSHTLYTGIMAQNAKGWRSLVQMPENL